MCLHPPWRWRQYITPKPWQSLVVIPNNLTPLILCSREKLKSKFTNIAIVKWDLRLLPLWDVTPCSSADIYRHIRGTCFLHCFLVILNLIGFSPGSDQPLFLSSPMPSPLLSTLGLTFHSEDRSSRIFRNFCKVAGLHVVASQKTVFKLVTVRTWIISLVCFICLT
jgi:hypothetical protein